VAQNETASNMDDGKVNENDVLGSIEIYNAKGLEIASNWTVKVGNNQIDASLSDAPDAIYDAKSDRVVWIDLSSERTLLTKISSLTF